MVNFEEHFWGEKYNGFDVLQHNFKQGFNASKEFGDFLKERSTIEENYSKALLKLATKCSAANTHVGCFEPCWKFLQSSTEKLANVHTQVIQHFNEVSKSCRDYGDQHKEKQKQMKDEFSATSEAVSSIQTLSAALIKAKELYQQRSIEVEKYRKDFTNLKDVKNAELKFKKSSEDYKQLVEKREVARKNFHEKMTEIAKKLQTEEENHLVQMLEILSKYGETVKTQRFLLEQIIDEFSRNMVALTVETLLKQFINLKQTGKEIPVIVDFEEIEMKSEPVNLDAIAQAIKEDKKKKKAEKRLKKAEKVGQRKKKKEKVAVNGSVEKTEANVDIENELQLDEEGYVIRSPADSESLHSGQFSKESFSSDSESDSDDEQQKLQVRIKPVGETTGSNSDLSEEQLKKLSATLTLMSPASVQEKLAKNHDDKKFVSIWGSHSSSLTNLTTKSRSNSDLLNIDKNSDTASLRSLPINSAISGLDTPTSGMDTPMSTRSSVENNAVLPPSNFEPSFTISPLASPDFTSSLPGSARMSPEYSFEKSIDSLENTTKNTDETTKNLDDAPPLPIKNRLGTSGSLSGSFDKSNETNNPITFSSEEIGTKDETFDETKSETNSEIGISDIVSVDKNVGFSNLTEQENSSSTTFEESSKNIKMFSNNLFKEDFTPPILKPSSVVETDKNNTSTKSKSNIEPLNPPPAVEKKSTSSTTIQPLPPPARSAHSSRSSSSLPRPKPSQHVPNLPSRQVTLPAAKPSTDNNAAFSDLLDINFSSNVQPLSPIRDKPSQENTIENTTSHWVNPETLDDSNNENTMTKIKNQLGDDIMLPPTIPRREISTTQTTAATTASLSATQVSNNERAIPIAVAFIETVNGLFKGADDKSCVVRVTGDMTISFPANMITMLATNPSPPVLSFIVTGTSSLEQIFPNKALVERGGQLAGGVGITYKFNMAALASYLKKQAERGTKASYYNIDILKYQVRCQGMASAPLQLSSYWRCDTEETDLRVDYQYNPSCMSTNVSLNNVSFIVPIDGGVTIMQSKPTAIWSSEHQRCMWKLAGISSSVDNLGFNSLRARFNLSRGPTVPAPIAVQFTGEGSTISLLNFDLTSPAYKLSLVKKRFTSGKYILE